MTGHVIDGKNLIPATGYLSMVWETMGLLHAQIHTELSVVFEDISFMRAIQIPKENELQLTVIVQKGIRCFFFIQNIWSAIAINVNCHYINIF